MHKYIYILIVCMIGLSTSIQAKRFAYIPDMISQTDEPQFPFPSIPMTLKEPSARLEYLLLHYWDNFDFHNPTLLNDPRLGEQGFVNFIALITESPINDELKQAVLKAFCSQMSLSKQGRKTFTRIAKEYLYHAQSPMHNESLYASFLREMLETNVLDNIEHQRISFDLNLVERNNSGSKATDFTYYTPDGRQKTLFETYTKSKYLILFFYDPECTQCRQTLNRMNDDKQLQADITAGFVTLLAIYTEDNSDVWKKSIRNMPKNWIVGDNRSEIKEQMLYDLKAMPTLYLLDNGRKVVLKDASFEKIKDYLTRSASK